MRSMTLRWRILGILLVVLALYIISSYGIQRLVVYPSYIELEENQARQDVERCVEALEREIHHIDTVAHDWAAWNDTYRFIADRNPSYIESNLLSHTFMDNRLNMLYVYNLKGELIWGEIRNLETGAVMKVPEFGRDPLPPDHFLLRNMDAEETVRGILLTTHAPLLFAARPVTTSDHRAPVRGALLMGRFLTAGFTRTLVEQTRVDHQYWPIQGNELPASGADVLARITPEDPVQFFPVDDRLLYVYKTVPDIFGKPVLLVRADLPRDINRRGSITLRFALLSLCLAGIVILLVLLVLLHKTIVGPLKTLTERVSSLRNASEARPAIYRNRKDEIGQLCREFDHLIGRLNRHHSRIRSLSSQLLLTEERERRRIATELHDRIGQNLAMSKLKVGLIVQSDGAADLRDDLEAVREMIDQAIQDARSLTFELSPPVLHELGLEPAIQWLAEALTARYGISVVCRTRATSIPTAERYRVLIFQAVRELLINAIKHAKAREVTVILGDVKDHLRIDIQDDGIGFDPSGINGTSGYNGGYGLFSIRERLATLGGRLDIRSAPGEGTLAVLTIPLTPSERLPELEAR